MSTLSSRGVRLRGGGKLIDPTVLTLYTEAPRGFFDTEGTNTREVFAEVADLGMNEYYLARSAGLSPTIVFEIPDYADYNNEKLCEYAGQKYRIVRATRVGMRERLTCERTDVNDDGGSYDNGSEDSGGAE